MNGHHSHFNLLILYATETGSAQDAADRIARQCRRMHTKARVQNMETYSSSELISEHLVIFVVATTGTGVEPRSMTPLWNMLLRSDLPMDLFEDLEFAVFGLGDTGYEKFCWPAKKLSRRLESLGATEICPRGEGDEQHHLGIDGALDPWMGTLVDTLLRLYPLPPGLELVSAAHIPPARVSMAEASSDALESCPNPFESDKYYHMASLRFNKRITANDWHQDVRHLEFEFDHDIQYKPGDVAVIHPEAPDVDVELFLSCMGYANISDVPFTIERVMTDQSLPDYLPRVMTLRILFTRYLDFNAVPRRSFFQLLRHFVMDKLEREKLEELVSDEGADDLYEYCHRVKRTIKEVLTEFRSARVPWEYIFDLFPPLRPREFSIASSIKKHPRHVQLCVAIVKYKTKLKVPRRGVCTTFLAALQPGDHLCIRLKTGLITLPKNSHTPIICVGPGTGVAPMRSVIQQRIHDGSKENTLYFGCRSASKDQHYGSEWASYAESGDIIYRTAFSRDGPEGVKRTYVQDLITADAETISDLLQNKGAYVYISGSSNKMPAAVREALRFAVVQSGKTEDEAKEYVKALERGGRLYEECWS